MGKSTISMAIFNSSYVKLPEGNECINQPADWDCFWLLEPRSMWQAQWATAHHQTGRLRRLRLHQNHRCLKPEGQTMEISGDLRWKTCLQIQFQNSQIFKWFRPQLDKHTCPSRKGLHCECTWHQLGIPKSSSSGRSGHPHSAVRRWFRKGHLLGIHSRNSEYTPGLSQPPAGCFKVQPRRWQPNQQKLETAEQQGAANLQSDG